MTGIVGDFASMPRSYSRRLDREEDDEYRRRRRFDDLSTGSSTGDFRPTSPCLVREEDGLRSDRLRGDSDRLLDDNGDRRLLFFSGRVGDRDSSCLLLPRLGEPESRRWRPFPSPFLFKTSRLASIALSSRVTISSGGGDAERERPSRCGFRSPFPARSRLASPLREGEEEDDDDEYDRDLRLRRRLEEFFRGRLE